MLTCKQIVAKTKKLKLPVTRETYETISLLIYPQPILRTVVRKKIGKKHLTKKQEREIHDLPETDEHLKSQRIYSGDWTDLVAFNVTVRQMEIAIYNYLWPVREVKR